MKKFWNWLMEALPILWGVLWVCIITVGSIALLIAVSNWLIGMLGVI